MRIQLKEINLGNNKFIQFYDFKCHKTVRHKNKNSNAAGIKKEDEKKLGNFPSSQIKITTLSDLNFSRFSRANVLDEIFNLIEANKRIKSKRWRRERCSLINFTPLKCMQIKQESKHFIALNPFTKCAPYVAVKFQEIMEAYITLARCFYDISINVDRNKKRIFILQRAGIKKWTLSNIFPSFVRP